MAGKYGFLKDGREICGPFSESDIYVHKDFIILGRRMMYWNDMDTVYEVCGFEKWYVNVESLSLTSLSKLMGQRKRG